MVLLGAGGVGKSALTARYVHDVFLEMYDPTIEDSYRADSVIDGKPTTLDILDTAGIEQFKAMRELYIRSSDGFILTYDTTNRDTLLELRPLHDQICRLKEDPWAPMIVVGTKVDLETTRNGVSRAEAAALAKEWRAPVIFTSAKENVNVNLAFEELVRVMVRRDSALIDASIISSASVESSVDSTKQKPKKLKSAATLRIRKSLAKLSNSKSVKKFRSIASFKHTPYDEGGCAFNPLEEIPEIPVVAPQPNQKHHTGCNVM